MAPTMSFGVQVAAILVGSLISTLLVGVLSWCWGWCLGRRRQGELARDIEMGVRAAMEPANDGKAGRETAPSGGWFQALLGRRRGRSGETITTTPNREFGGDSHRTEHIQDQEQPPGPSQQGSQ